MKYKHNDKVVFKTNVKIYGRDISKGTVGIFDRYLGEIKVGISVPSETFKTDNYYFSVYNVYDIELESKQLEFDF